VVGRGGLWIASHRRRAGRRRARHGGHAYVGGTAGARPRAVRLSAQRHADKLDVLVALACSACKAQPPPPWQAGGLGLGLGLAARG
jgi:hypothetical protein